MMLKMVLFCIAMVIIPFLVGMLYMGRQKRIKALGFLGLLQGMFTIFGVFQIVAIPLIFLRESLTLLVWVMGVIVGGLMLLSLVLHIKKIPDIIRAYLRALASMPWQLWAAGVFVVIQTCISVIGFHVDNDDAFYVASAATAVETDTIFSVNPYTGDPYGALPTRYVLSPFPGFIGMLSKVSGIHTAVIAHTLLPAILIPFCYVVYALIGKKLFRSDKKKIGNFLILVSVIHIFSNYSVYTTGVFLLTRVWQGKAVLTGILLPAVICLGLYTFDKKGKGKNWISMLLLMFSCCMVSSMGVFLGALVFGMLAVVGAIGYKRFSIIPLSIVCCLPNMLYGVIYIFIK